MRIEGKARVDDSIDVKLHINTKNSKERRRVFKVKLSALEIAGLSAYFGWIFCFFWSPSTFSIDQTDTTIHLIRMIMMIFMAFSYAAFGIFASFLVQPRGEFLLKFLALFLSPSCCVATVFEPYIGPIALTTIWVLSGMGTAALLLVWSKTLIRFNRKQLILSTAIAFFSGSFLYLSTSFLPFPISGIVIALFPISSLAFAALSISNSNIVTVPEKAKYQSPEEQETIPQVEEDEVLNEDNERLNFMRTIFLALAYSAGIGFVGSCATVFEFYPFNVYIITAGNILAGIGVAVFLVRRSRNIMVLLTEIFLPCVLLCIFLFSFVGYIGQMVCLFFMFIIFACHDIIDIGSISGKTDLFGKNHIKTFAYGRTLNGVGAALGWIAGYVMNFIYFAQVEERLFVCFALVVFLVFASSFAVFHPGLYSLYCKAHDFSDDEGKENERGLNLRDKVQYVVAHYGLTVRQGEVLYYLAQGRNSEYIRQKFTISKYTVKSHIYNIYAKLQIHSQQDLLDIFDNIDEEERELE